MIMLQQTGVQWKISVCFICVEQQEPPFQWEAARLTLRVFLFEVCLQIGCYVLKADLTAYLCTPAFAQLRVLPTSIGILW